MGACLAAAMLPRFGAFAAPPDGGQLPTIRPLMVLRPMAASTTEYELLIYGDIGDSWWGESVTALSIVQQLQALDAAVTQINVRINSFGGSVSDGIAIYTALKRHSARKVVTVDGVAMSSASLIAMAGDEVQMAATSLLMIHAPWGYAQGNAQDMREMASVLDIYAAAMANAYVSKTGKDKAVILSLLEDGKDHYYTGEQAVAEGFADKLVDALTDQSGDGEGDAAARAAGVTRLLSSAPENIRKLAVAAAARRPMHLPKAEPPRLRVPADLDMPSLQAALASASGQRALVTALTTAASADDGELTMKLRKLFAAMASLREPANDPADGGRAGGGGSAAPAPNAAFVAAMRERNDAIHAALEPFKGRAGIDELLVQALQDPTMTVEQVREKVLAKLGASVEPLNGGPARVEMGADTRDKLRGAAEQILLARHGVLAGAEADKARQGNPFATATLIGIAERMLMASGVDTRGMTREDIARRALAAGQSTGDFPVLLENVLHKTLVGAYNLASFTWNRFCDTGTLTDYRPHNRYHLSSFSDLREVGEGGEYKTGTLGDGEKETIQGKRKGRILEITPEVLINDDLGAFVRLTQALGQAAGRTIEKDVYALFALNGGNGPTMSDGKPLFHADHKNLMEGADLSVDSIDAMRQALAKQMDPAGNDYLDLQLAVFLGPLTLGGTARTINDAQYDTSVSNKFQVPNKVRGLFRDVVDTPRLTGNAWYGFCDPGMEPVFEVAFLDGVQTPTLQQETNFRTDGLAWKVVHRYGVAAVGWRGVQKNPGK
jgi:ATP-dependent protease ClpP protease subunit